MTSEPNSFPLGSNVHSLEAARLQQDINRVFAQHREYPQALLGELRETSLLAAAGGSVGIGIASSPLPRSKPDLIDGFAKLADRWELNQNQQLTLLGLADNPALGRIIIAGTIEPPFRDIQDRVALLLGISISLGEMYDDDRDAELKWLHTPFDGLGRSTPMDLILKGPMVQLVEVHNFLRFLRSL